MSAPDTSPSSEPEFPPVFIYCRWEAPAGVERVSLRLRDFLGRQGLCAALVAREGGQVFGARVRRLDEVQLRGAVVLFSRKRDLPALWRSGAGRIYWRHVPVPGRGWRRWVEIGFLAAMSRSGPVVCVCDELAAEIAALPVVRAEAVRACLSPVAADLPARVAIRAGPSPRELIHVGRPGGQKRLDLVLEAVARARAQGLDLRLTVFGYPAPRDLPQGVRFAPSGSDPLAALRRADALILWSSYEGFPTVMVEAAIAGTPILANGFRTGLADFERLIGPVVRIGSGGLDLADALGHLAVGHYALGALKDAALWPGWRAVIAEGISAEYLKSDAILQNISDFSSRKIEK